MPDPDKQYVETIQEQIRLRSTSHNLDITQLQEILRSNKDGFEGDLVFFAASDFGRPVALVPSTIDEPQGALNLILEQIHKRPSEGGKWSAEHLGLRKVKNEVFDEVNGIHKGFPALVHEDDTVEYDITAGKDNEYNFVTIRQVVGLVDWCTNSFQAESLTSQY